jgi:hypothetical protein
MEDLELINQQLIDLFGLDTSTGQAIWRVVWSEDQFEKRYGTYRDFTPNGLFIREVTEVREAPKYRQWIREKYVLERLIIVPDTNKEELLDVKMSYEPLFIFEDKHRNALPPRIDVAKIVIDVVYAAQGKKSLANYVDEEAKNDPKRTKAVEKVYNELFGEETELTDALARGSAVSIDGLKEN